MRKTSGFKAIQDNLINTSFRNPATTAGNKESVFIFVFYDIRRHTVFHIHFVSLLAQDIHIQHTLFRAFAFNDNDLAVGAVLNIGDINFNQFRAAETEIKEENEDTVIP